MKAAKNHDCSQVNSKGTHNCNNRVLRTNPYDWRCVAAARTRFAEGRDSLTHDVVDPELMINGITATMLMTVILIMLLPLPLLLLIVNLRCC